MLTPHGPGPILMNKDQLANIQHAGHPNDYSWRFGDQFKPKPLPPVQPVRIDPPPVFLMPNRDGRL